MILDKIVESTKIRVNKIYENENVNKIKEDAIELAKNDKDKYRFEKSLKTKPIAFICEVKKASPSKGIIAKDFPYVEIAKNMKLQVQMRFLCLQSRITLKEVWIFLKK